jgi:hypothetical protein
MTQHPILTQIVNFLSNQTESNSVPDPLFATEKELILYVIREETYESKIYNEHALPEWKAQYPVQQGYVYSFDVWRNDASLILEIAETSDDEELLRAIYDTHRTGFLLGFISHIIYPKLYLNVNLPDDLIDCYINSSFFLIEDLSEESDRLQEMLKVGFNSTVNERIQRRIEEIVNIKRKIKEDKTKNKLKAFLITASATKSVIAGNSIDDIVDASITEDVDEQVLDYMTKLFGNEK